MALKITVRKNSLPACSSPFVIRSESSDIVDFDQFVDFMAKGRTTLTKTDIVAAMQLYKEELQRQLAEGKTVKTPTGSFFLCAGGTMENLDESFLPWDKANNHEIRLHHKPERSFETAIKEGLKTVREEKPDLGAPSITLVRSTAEDGATGIHPGDIVQVRGLRLRFEAKDPNQGIFFVADSGAEVRSPFYPMILPRTILASVPQTLAPGLYAVEVRAAVNGKDTKRDSYEGVSVTSA